MIKRRRLLLCDSLKFFILYNNEVHEFKFLKNMTWTAFVASRFNDGNFSVSGSNILFNGYKVSLNDNAVSPSGAITEKTIYGIIIPHYIFKEGSGLVRGTYYGESADSVTVNSSYIKCTGFKVTPIIVDGSPGSSWGDEEYGYNGALLGETISTESYYPQGNGFDVTQYKTLYIEAKTSAGIGQIGLVSSSGRVSGLRYSSATDRSYQLSPRMVRAITATNKRNVYAVDVSGLSGKYFIAALSPWGYDHVTAHNIWFE